MKTARFVLLLAALAFGCGGSIAAPLTGVSAISAGGFDGYLQDIDHSCAIKAGDVVCWGYNGQGQLGNGTTVTSIFPVAVSGLSGITAIASGNRHTCAITSAGTVKCWGGNAGGALGDGTTTDRTTPVDVIGIPAGVTAIAAGAAHTCALSTGGVLTCWGYNLHGQLGDGTIGAGIIAVAAGEAHTCAVTSAGALKCWGNNVVGQLGDGTETSSLAPRDVQGLSSGVLAVSASALQTCALLSGGTVKCWGYNTSSTSPNTRNTPQDVTGFGNPVTALTSSNNQHHCAITSAGNVKCWGDNTRGQLGINFRGYTFGPGADVIGLSSGVTSVVAGANHSCAIVAGGEVKCWGLLTETTWAPGNMFNLPFLPTPQTVGILAQAITFHAPDNRDLSASPFTLPATSTSGLAIVYTSRTPGTCAVSGGTLDLLTSGVCLLTASQPGNSDYYAATPVDRGFLITDAAAATTPRLANISSRGQVLAGNPMIAGFIVGGSIPKTVVVTVAGPSLVNAGIANRLENPTLTLVRQSDGAIIATNDNSGSQTNPSDLEALQVARMQPLFSDEPAIIATLPPGAYTAVVQGVGGTTGNALVGVYEVDHPETPLSNISTRAQVQNGNDVLIAGFIIQGNNSRNVVVTVAGPSLSNAGVPNPLSNPMVTIVRQSDGVVIASNDDWQSQANPGDVATIQNAGFAVAHPQESAVYLTLPPGAYTAIVQGVGGRVGVALVGVYVAP
ncbi:RCC1 domain-containing protein [Usitatibacter palustris]|uniref:Alpha-tubulin suppressor n=1 Tax=Usitatibacter palustris TaxID=2732487 RepID=A0A6M4HDB0_9PROT|nr:RCC1 domain-containing protein [Usitatibacter palustris]QJR16523.1 hypothetical protein DSM104440_03358 [Usitatibacter palustris]